eukprot:COSAG01_NODE_67944_length_265_cov_1.222892_1_plen_22_part_01
MIPDSYAILYKIGTHEQNSKHA